MLILPKKSSPKKSQPETEAVDGDPDSLAAVLNVLVEQTQGEKVTLGDMLDQFGDRAYGPMLLVPAVIAVAPTGAIPGMSLVTGGIIFLIATQMLLFRARPWLPKLLLGFSFSRTKLTKSIESILPWVKWLEAPLDERLTFLVKGPAKYVIAVTCILLAASMYPLALLPFAVAVPGTAVVLFALAMTTRDGLLAFCGYAATVGAGVLMYFSADAISQLWN